MILLLAYVGGAVKLPFGWELQNLGFRAAQKSISQLSDPFFFFFPPSKASAAPITAVLKSLTVTVMIYSF